MTIMSIEYLDIKEINDRLCYIAYKDVKVLVMKNNGFVNGTKLCESANKCFLDWLKSESHKELIKEIDYTSNYLAVKKNSIDLTYIPF
ncbi:SWPV1-278 [Shearwaterpox virus]|uniref:SWPV1-278 n=1 Tax=Shearwaterpox virus TaxID=1974596 RepID=A0A1V0S899_CNPV|nr:SWPV1-278 [Shearwaterpox virus]